MQSLGIIGGSGLTRLAALDVDRQEVVTTLVIPSAPWTFGHVDGSPIVFCRGMAAHTRCHRIA